MVSRFHEQLLNELDLDRELSDAQVLLKIDELIMMDGLLKYESIESKERLRAELFSRVRQLDVLQELIDDSEVTEIMINGADDIFIERRGCIVHWEKSFASSKKLDDVIQKIVGNCNRSVNEGQPIVDARLPNGARVNVVLKPVALNGPIVTIRRFPDEPITMERLIQLDCVTEEAAQFLKELVEARYSMVIGGATSTGKTTFLNALSNYIPSDERVITIEDNAELQIQGVSNLVSLEAKSKISGSESEVTIRDLIKSALRMRPDRIVLGEVRSGEAFDLLQAFNTGHEGSLTTAHANSAKDMINRLEAMVLMGMQLPIEAIRRQIASGVEIFLHLGRMRDKSRKLMQICEVDGFADGQVALRTLFERDADGILRRKNDLKNIRKLELK